jgi:hypothetical protein
MKFDYHGNGMEYAAGSVRRLPDVTRKRWSLLKHARCGGCGSQATSIFGSKFCCDVCAEHERTMWRGRHIIEMAHLRPGDEY